MAVDGRRLMTKTQHYRKVTKPLLERRRRARMNRYLDELKDLIVDTMEEQGEHINKLEKADILELTVTYLRTQQDDLAATRSALPHVLNVEKFRAGYTQAVYEVSTVFAALPELDLKFGARLMKHLGAQLKNFKPPLSRADAGSETSSSTGERVGASGEAKSPHLRNETAHRKDDEMWRPW